jgi:hypothetical protein
MQRNPSSDAKLAQELDTKIFDATQKINMLNGAIKQFSGLVVGSPVIDEEQENYAKGLRRTGRLKIRLNGAVNLSGKSSSKNYFIVVRIDGNVKATSKSGSKRIDESLDIQINKAQEIEFAVYEK